MRYLLLLLPLISLTACGPEIVYEREVDFAETGWAYADTVRFDFELADTSRAYDLLLTVEHGTDFPYENFYVRIHTTFPSGKRNTEQVSLQTTGDFGAFLGECSGGDCSLPVLILENARFAATGDYALTVEQYSRDEPLSAVFGLGLRIVVSD